jgi:hypothetical protein
MGELMDNIRLQKLALQKVLELNGKSNEELDNILVEINNAYEIKDDHWLTISTAFSILSTRKVLGELKK